MSYDLVTGSHDVESESHDLINESGDVSNDDSIQELSENGLTYRALLSKEKMEDGEMDTIPMDDIAVCRIDKNIKQNNSVKTRLIQAKKQAVWSCRILLSLLRYVKMKQNFS